MRLINIIYKIVIALLMLFCAGIFIFGLFATVVFRQYQENDYPDFVRLNPLATLAVFLIAAGLVLVFTVILSGRSCTHPAAGISILLTVSTLFCAFLIFFIHGLPTNDARILYEITQDFLAGDYSAIDSGYLAYCPHQLSYVLLGEIITKLFGPGAYLPYQILNVISILMTVFFLYLTACMMYPTAGDGIAAQVSCRESAEHTGVFDPKYVRTALCVTGLLCLMLYVYCTFIYNDIICLGPLFAAFYFLMVFIRIQTWVPVTPDGSDKGRHGMIYGILSALFMSISFVLKTNGAVALIAMECIIAAGIISVIHTCRNAGHNESAQIRVRSREPGKIIRLILVGILTAVLSFGANLGIIRHYERVSGLTVNGGEPALSYIAMGLEETDGKYGWYNGMNVRFLKDAGLDSGEASRAASAWIKERISFFADNPRYTLKFFGFKLLSQWGDPTKASLREQELTGRHQEGQRPAFAENLTFGTGYYFLQCLMHVFHLLLYFFSFFGLAGELSDHKPAVIPDVCRWLLPVFLFGGILFHMMWEASGRYTLRYELVLLPYAAAGAAYLAGKLRALNR